MRKWKPSPSRRRERCNSICATPGCASWSGRSWRGGTASGSLQGPGCRSSRMRTGRPRLLPVALRPTRRRSSAPDPGARRRSTPALPPRGPSGRPRRSSRTAEMPSGARLRRRDFDAMRLKRMRPGNPPVRVDRPRRILFSHRIRCRRPALRRTGRGPPTFALLRPSIRSRRPRMQCRRRIFHLSFRAGNGRRDLST